MALYRSRIKDDNWDYMVEIDFFFQSFEVYRKEVNNLIEKEIEIAKQNYNEYKQQENELAGNIHYELEFWDHHVKLNVGSNLREIYYDSMIVLLYSFLERQLFFLCKHLEKDHRILLEDIAGKGIFKFNKYLGKVIEIDSSELKDNWDLIMHFNKIRNHVVHSDGNRLVSKSNNLLIQAIESLPGVTIKEIDQKWLRFRFENDQSIALLQHSCAVILHFYFHKKSS